ncbi:hemin transporter [Arthrobacter sp. MYb227]|uniref:globin domain-containing protein n=1 Tax=Arthrobacter sp. MYb227 TaxID=1848601 RepID=UPI000CFCD717|nr:globin domain-containing protein [Arthrobacter sp. MYb227]PQZ86962.1 hemin transporter [Arthrobacter sp. MYb227]
MLSAAATPTIVATLPVVGANIGEITQRFYKHLFEAHPQLLDGVFNRSNQQQGHQAQALAGSVAAFATMLISNPGQLPEALLSRISHKHASLGISADQYEVVHEHLFWAIADVLGEAVTPEVASAWDEVYWLMANTLINLERGLYAVAGRESGAVWDSWTVVQKITENTDTLSFVVARTDGSPASISWPGQYVSVQVQMADGASQPRQYSLTRAHDGIHRVFTVKRVQQSGEPLGEVSNRLHDTVSVGDQLTISEPFGDVVLEPSSRPVVLASAGIGVAPMAGMISHLAREKSSRQVHFLHADFSPTSFALREQVEADLLKIETAQCQYWFEEPGTDTQTVRGGYMVFDSIELPADADYYLCGPLAFMQSVRGQLLERGVPPRAIRYEVFGPDLWQADFA